MNHETTETLRDAACVNLPPEVTDKYFTASPLTQPFEHHTARAICRQCVAQVACLEDAISSPAVFTGSERLIRGGEPGSAVQELRRKHFLTGTSAAVLADSAIRQQFNAPTVGDYHYLRSGTFRDAVLATQWEPTNDA